MDLGLLFKSILTALVVAAAVYGIITGEHAWTASTCVCAIFFLKWLWSNDE